MNENLRQHRGEPTIWERSSRARDTERWLVAGAAGACLAVGLRRRTTAGLVLAALGGALAWWAAGDLNAGRRRLSDLVHGRRRRLADAALDEISRDSFPASDPPPHSPSRT